MGEHQHDEDARRRDANCLGGRTQPQILQIILHNIISLQYNYFIPIFMESIIATLTSGSSSNSL